MTKPIKTIWVDSWRDIPCPDKDSTLGGYAEVNKRCVYVIKGKSTDGTVEHEKYHILKRHSDYPRDYRDYIQMELEAIKYGFDKTGSPRRVLMKLRAIFNDIIRRKSYKAMPRQIIAAIESSLHSVDAPKSWFTDLERVKVEARREGWKV